MKLGEVFMSVLKVSNLKKSYKAGFIPRAQEVLKGIDFTIEPGKITGFLGANGAGKTTTMKCILGLCEPDSGDIRYFNNQLLDTKVKSKIGFLPERPYFYEYLTGEEFLIFYGQLSTNLKKSDLKVRIKDLLKKVDLLHAKDKALRGYSKGMLQKIGFAQALIHDPDFVILDEPMSGLDPDGRYYLSELIKEVAHQEGKAVFFSSHLLPDAEKLCQNLVIIKNGKVVFEGETLKLLEQVHRGFEIVFAKDEKLEKLKVVDENDLQQKIDHLRSENHRIYEVKKLNMSLEEAFVNIALEKKL